MWILNQMVGLIAGVVASLVSLAVLFSIKPRLRLTLEKRSPSGAWVRLCPLEGWMEQEFSSTGPSSTGPSRTGSGTCTKESEAGLYRVEVENLGLCSVVEVEARLWWIGDDKKRHSLALNSDQLLELSGKWHEARRTKEEVEDLRVGDSFFRFLLEGESENRLISEHDRYLFQVWSKHGFTNFGRVHRLRLLRDGGNYSYPDDGRKRRRGFAPIARMISWRFATRPEAREALEHRRNEKWVHAAPEDLRGHAVQP